MAERLIRIRLPGVLVLLLLVGGGLAYEFVNYREEGRMRTFFRAVSEERYEDAYAMWDGHERYYFEHFLEDWGPEGYYSRGRTEFEIVESNQRGASVVVYADVGHAFPLAVLVNKQTGILSFSPENKYRDGTELGFFERLRRFFQPSLL
jgi:hypothetical protein